MGAKTLSFKRPHQKNADNMSIEDLTEELNEREILEPITKPGKKKPLSQNSQDICSQKSNVSTNPYTPNENSNSSSNSYGCDSKYQVSGFIDHNDFRSNSKHSIVSNNSYNSTSKEISNPTLNVGNRSIHERNFSINSKSNSNFNSNNSSHMKNRSGFSISKKQSDHKTESTYISNGDSSSSMNLNLDCEETLSSNFLKQCTNQTQGILEADDYPLVYDFEPNDYRLGHNNQQDDQEVILPKVRSHQNNKMTIEEELSNFNPDSFACAFDSETINYMISMENEYNPDPHYFERRQKHIGKSMRIVLMDWMMEVSNEFTLKRETFHYAVNYVDRYLSVVSDVERQELQLVGLAAMHIASKNEVQYQ